MIDDRTLHAIACLFYMAASAQALWSMGARQWRANAWNARLILGGFAFHTAFLSTRGHAIGHCPISNFFEILALLSWAIVLSYLLLGSIFRLSLLGIFTAPLVLLLNFVAAIFPWMDNQKQISKIDYWVEMHAGLTILAFGIFGLASMAAALYLVIDRSLKHRANPEILHSLPPLHELDMIGLRVGWLAFALFSMGILAGLWAMNLLPESVKLIWAGTVWCLYAAILAARQLQKISPIRHATLSIASFLFVLITFWGIHSWSHLQRYPLP